MPRASPLRRVRSILSTRNIFRAFSEFLIINKCPIIRYLLGASKCCYQEKYSRFSCAKFFHLFITLIFLGMFVSPSYAHGWLQAGSITQYEWELLRWSDLEPVCQFNIYHDGTPSSAEVYSHCGEELYQLWLITTPCTNASDGGDTSTCAGVYLNFVEARQIEGSTKIGEDSIPYATGYGRFNLPRPIAWLSIENCEYRSPGYHCSGSPSLIIQAEESLPSEQITKIEGHIYGTPFLCQDARCEVDLPGTGTEGIWMEFWTESSSGQRSLNYEARLRVIQDGDGTSWLVNVLSNRWIGESISSCEQIWGVFPPLDPLPSWLETPQQLEMLGSTQPFAYLGGRLLANNMVDATECARFGIENNGYASPCGMEIVRHEVDIWQNRFDEQIMNAAMEHNIPAQLLKNLFAQESQFWPGSYFLSPEERGIGQLTPEGADVVLLWKEGIFEQYCPRVMHPDTCKNGYVALSEYEKAMVQGAVMQAVDADCNECPLGVDLEVANESIELFAQVLIANCLQTGQTVSNARGMKPGLVSSYEDLWRYTLINYHLGVGCLNAGIQSVPFDQPLTWESMQSGLNTACPGGIDYIKGITR